MNRQRRASRVVSPIILSILRAYAWLTGQQRARVLVRDDAGNILLIWEVIGTNRWSIPGGGIKRGEVPIEAAARELREETGLDVPIDAFEYIGFFEKSATGNGYDAHLFVVTVLQDQLSAQRHNQYEIIEMRWFHVDALPSPLSPFVRIALEGLSKTSKI